MHPNFVFTARQILWTLTFAAQLVLLVVLLGRDRARRYPWFTFSIVLFALRLLAEVLLAEVKPPEESEIRSAIQEIQERAIKAQLRDLRTLLEAARDEGSPEWNALLLRQLELDRALRRLHQHQEPV